MRKKYLSALLFGALLFASAGTFTSCKDYDDDIDNLQSQIDKVVSDLASLKSTVENLKVGVTSVTVDGDQLVVVTDGATTKMNLPVGVQVSEIEIKDGHLYVGGVDKGAIAGETEKAQKVEVKEDGFLYIDDVKQEGLHVGTDVVIKDASNGVYTITIGKDTIQLPMASTKIVVEIIESDLDNYTDALAIQWNYLTTDKNWGGPKGKILANQLLVGPTPTATILVTPASTDLSAQTLTLVNSEGGVAPVKVTATAGDAYTTDRAAGAGWIISIAMDDTVTKDNIASAFTDGKTSPRNYKYALAVNGAVVSSYDFVIDTRTSKNAGTISTSKIQVKNEGTTRLVSALTSGVGLTAKLGTYTFTLENYSTNTDMLNYYDAYIELTNKDDADSKGVSANGLTVTSDAALAGAKTVTAKLHIMPINGTEVVSNEFGITFKGSTTAEEAIGAQSFKIMPNSEEIKINLGDAFTGLTAAQAEAINTRVSWKTDKKFLIENLPVAQITYYSDESCAANKKVELTASTIRNIKYAKIKLEGSNPLDQLVADPAAGTSKITITMKDVAGNEVKKVTTDLEVSLPTFDELFTKTNKWSDGAFNTVITASSANAPAINFTQAFEAQSDATTNTITYAIDKVNDNDILMSNSAGSVLLQNITNNSTSELVVKTIQVTATYKIAGKDGLTIKSEKFTTNMKSIFEGAALKFFVDDEAKDLAAVDANNQIIAYNKPTDGKANGLAVVRGTGAGSIALLKSGVAVDGLTLQFNTTPANGVINVTQPTVEGLSGITVNDDYGTIKFTGLNVGDEGKLVFTFKDFAGIVTKLKIDFKKN